ncbi:MAG TPA: bifunctional 4-hydroxy-2-oxoglutarate aldolase/2-dehydro-3-deoxy-phosphogluconate aldolase [Terriglobales bacterium]|nr:bifunctional 4-hydroxy-2-oxoglutarate aldolase/2-dehydro-3-deoxy-phosphogluconate aldolase [Terriglobales bacterium]
MEKQHVVRKVLEIGIVPVVRAASAAQAQAAAEAVRRGGIPIVEITMTVPGAVEVIRELVRSAGNDVLVGAGTVLDAETARRCLDAGAQFLVSPGFNAGMVAEARARDTVVMAGALTPSEIMAAIKAGADFVKIFPCAQVGGAAYIKALRGPFPSVPFVPTGGVTLATAAEFLRAGAAALGVGGELVERSALEQGKTLVIMENAQRFVEIVQQTRQQMAQAAGKS